jgi:DNA-binding MarR family transcriptional regulator
MSAMGRELGVSLSAMTQIADRLERAGLVKRVVQGPDRRVRQLQLTPRGDRIMQGREQARVARVLGALERLTPEARDHVETALCLLRDACTASAPRPGMVKTGVRAGTVSNT